MKKYIVFFVLILISACAAPVVATPAVATQSAPETLLASPTALLVPLAATTSTLIIPPPAPPLHLPPVSTFLPPAQIDSPNEIKFDAGGTWKDIHDSVPLGGSKTYTLNAAQGQVMSVSVMGGYFLLQIQGRDGTTLCPVEQNIECDFWRGALPLSQDYYITVNSGGDGTDFTLRVAINPPGRAEQTFNYDEGGIALAYSDQFAPANIPSSLNHKTDLKFALQWIDTSSYVGTNLGAAYFVFGSSTNSQIVASCVDPLQSGVAPETANGKVAFNGYDFTSSVASDAGAGNIYDQYIYRVAEQGVCYEAIFFIHYSNIGNYSPGAVKEFDQPGLLQKFNGILAAIQLK